MAVKLPRLVALPVSLGEANAFVLTHHRHSKPVQGMKFAIGVIAEGEEACQGVVIVGRPIARLLQDGWTAEALRVCVDPSHAQKGACSFLYGAAWRAWRAMGGRRLVTYTLAAEGGASLRGAGWRAIAEVSPSAGWSRTNRARAFDAISSQHKLRWEAPGAPVSP